MARPIPDGMNTLIPHLVCAGAADAIAFYQRAFGAQELSRMPAPDGRVMNAQLRIGSSVLMLHDEWPEVGALGPQKLGGSPVTIHFYVADVDAAMAQAAAAGASITMPAMDMFWGDRYGQLTDPFGHKWSLATHLEDLTPEQIQANFAKLPPMQN